MLPGDTFLLDIGCGTHLHVVLSYPEGAENEIIVAMISTWDDHQKNDACVLRASDGHPFIKHDSYVVFNMSTNLKVSDITCRLNGKIMPSFSQEVIQRILKGANLNSSDLPSKYWCIMDRQGLFTKS